MGRKSANFIPLTSNNKDSNGMKLLCFKEVGILNDSTSMYLFCVQFSSRYLYVVGLPSTPESEKKLDIGDIEIDEDSAALDAFLETPEPTGIVPDVFQGLDSC